ncbi:MAG: RluA family pseudouridine synthase [Patescibacteria group bacterium]
MKQTITVPALSSPTRLDKFLVQHLGQMSRSYLQKAIKKGKVLVDQKKVTVHRWLKQGEIISFDIEEQLKPRLNPNKKIKFKVLADSTYYLVIDKPEGLVVHPATGVNEPTLVDGLVAYYPTIKDLGNDPLRPGIVHRLDRDVSGLMVIAKTEPMFIHLKNQFKERLVHKEYTGLVMGQIASPAGIIDFPLARSKTKHGKIAARPKNAEGIDAITKFEVLKKYSHTTLLKIEIETGRTHQIRAHLAALGYPLMGDKVYRPTKGRSVKKIKRLFLHASTLAFTDLEGKQQLFTSPLPKELNDYLTTLR